ncbi:MAG: UDP-glucose 4-epimerase GalE [Flavobacteriales bacterium]|nr:MAG: UDP-glucose 4-epimerase GalE [Flavobacteriales bacterium]
MKVLVTGGLGYIGSHTVVALHEAGHEVVIIDNLDNTNIGVLDALKRICDRSFNFYERDIRQQESLEEVFSQEKNVEAVIHFAARKSVNESLKMPAAYFDHNIKGLINVIATCEKFAVHRFIFSSSCTVYGDPDVFPVTELTPRKKSPTPYGNSKRIGEEILEEYASLKPEFRVILLRYFNPVGAHESALIGELPLGVPANLMPFITQTAAGIREKLRVFGKDYETRDGTAIRDFIHVMDLAEAHVVSLDYANAMQQTNIDVFNIGTGTGNTVLEVIEAFERVNNIKLNYAFVDRRDGDVEKIWADTEKADSVLGWRAKRSLDDMALSAWQWQKNIDKK